MVRLGAHDLSVPESGAEDYRVWRVVHPEYSDQQEVPEHDIALLALHTQDRRGLRGKVSPACLPAPGLQVTDWSTAALTSHHSSRHERWHLFSI